MVGRPGCGVPAASPPLVLQSAGGAAGTLDRDDEDDVREECRQGRGEHEQRQGHTAAVPGRLAGGAHYRGLPFARHCAVRFVCLPMPRPARLDISRSECVHVPCTRRNVQV